MAIYDCFQYFNEDHMVDIRLNILNDHVDYFVISESTKTHQGKSKKINFDPNKTEEENMKELEDIEDKHHDEIEKEMKKVDAQIAMDIQQAKAGILDKV